jgi:AcrR family transcriptional regulator
VVTPAPPRPTRPHGQRSRQRILDAAIACLVDLGYAGTTTVAVQRRAGVTRGALLHHFPSRDELLVAAVAHLGEARFDALLPEVEEAARHGKRIDAAIDITWESFEGPLFIAATELWLAARTHPELRAVLVQAERQLGKRFRNGYAEVFGDYSRHPRFPEFLDLLLSSMRGAALVHNLGRNRRHDAAHLRAWKRLAHELLS